LSVHGTPRPAELEIGSDGATASAREHAFERAARGDVRGARAEIELHLRTATDDGPAHRLHAATLMHTGDLSGAINAFQLAIRHGCDDASTHVQLGMSLKFRGRCAEALKHFDRACALDPSDGMARWTATIATLPMVYSTQAEVVASVAKFAERLEALDAWWSVNPRVPAENVVGEPNPFHLAYVERDNIPELARYGRLCSRLMAIWDGGRPRAAPVVIADPRTRIGLVSRYLYRHSVWTAIVKGMMQTLDPARFRFELFHVGDKRDAETDFARAIAGSYTPSLLHTDSAVDAIRSLTPDILIYPEIGMDPLSTRLAALRLAPLQMASWGHPITTGLPTIDRFLSAEAFEPEGAQAHYTETLAALPGLGARVEREPVDPAPVDFAGLGLDARRPVFVCPGVPWKYLPSFDDALCAIAARVPEAQFVFFRPIVQLAAAEQLRSRIARRFSAAGIQPEGRIVFIPWLGRSEFLGLVRAATACLDGFGFSGFNTVLQTLQVGTPMVTLKGRYMRGRLASGVLEHVGLADLVADDVAGFVERAAGCVPRKQDASVRTHIGAAVEKAFDDPAPIMALDAYLKQI
jgi:protein O-GlcNAc transferase